MPATLTVIRDVGFGIELRRGRFEVLLDGSSVGSLDDHATVEVPVPPGHHTVEVRKGRYSSRVRSFNVVEGKAVVTFRCHGIRIWPMYVASILAPSLAITLTRD